MKRTIASLLALGLLGVFSATGCGDDGNNTTSGGTPATPIKLDELGTKMGSLFCGIVYSCCTPMEQTELFQDFPMQPMNEAECNTQLKALFEKEILADLQAGVMAGRLKYDETLAGTCFASMDGQCSVLQNDGPFSGPGCEKVFVGLVADGGDCASEQECATTGHFCDMPQGAMMGKCVAPPTEGQTCANGYQCADGLACAFINNMGTCVKPLADGQMCTTDAECISELCDFNTSLCIPRKALGTDCFASYECVDNAYCEMQMKKCTAQKAGGEACTSFDECLSYDCDMATSKCTAVSQQPQCDGM